MNELKFRKLYASEIDCRVSVVKENGCSILLYKDARVDQRLLDETVGPFNWQRTHEVINGNLFCSVGIYVNRGESDEWVWKQDVGTESYTEKEKGQASDAFKRACFNWGIGRELYTAPFIWIDAKDADIVKNGNKYTTYARFKVAAIGYKDNAISYLKITRNKKTVYEAGDPSTVYTAENVTLTDSEAVDQDAIEDQKKTEETKEQLIDGTKIKALNYRCKEAKINGAMLCKLLQVEDFTKITEAMFKDVADHWEDYKKRCS